VSGPNVTPFRPPAAWAARLEGEAKADERRFRYEAPDLFPKPGLPKLVRGMIAHTDLVLVYGGWGSGKSFFVIDLACCLASGDFWRGRACDAGLVAYVAGEAPGSIKSRILAWLMRRGKVRKGEPLPPIGVIGASPDLLNGAADLEEFARELEAAQETHGTPLRAIVFDTVHACAPGCKEDAADFGAILSKVRPLIARFNCAVILVHHAGKDPGRGARGSVSLEAAADVIVEVAEDGGIRTPAVRKLRDGALPELEPFTVDTVLFGQGTEDEVRVGVHELIAPPEDPGDPRKAKAKAMRKEGIQFAMIAKCFGVSISTAERWCKDKVH
jgi:hypothetical protein